MAAFVSSATPTVITFDELAAGTAVADQYASQGVLFRDQLSAVGGAPSAIVYSLGAGNGNALKSTDSAKSMYILLNQPAHQFTFNKWEPPLLEQPPTEEQQPTDQPTTEAPTESAPTEEYTVYWKYYTKQGDTYVNVGNGLNSEKDSWVSQSFTFGEDIYAIEIYGDIINNQPYYLDNLKISQVPEPVCGWALLATGVAAFLRARKK